MKRNGIHSLHKPPPGAEISANAMATPHGRESPLGEPGPQAEGQGGYLEQGVSGCVVLASDRGESQIASPPWLGLSFLGVGMG